MCRAPQNFSEATMLLLLADARRRSMTNEQEWLRVSKERDAVVDVWRTMVDEARLEVLKLRRDEELQLFERLLRAWLAKWLQAPRVVPDGQDGKPTRGRPGDPEVVPQPPLVDAGRHPMTWCLDMRLGNELDPIVNPTGSRIGALGCKSQMQ